MHTSTTSPPHHLATSPPATRAPSARLFLITLCHLCIDFYAAMFAPLAETFASAFRVSMAQISWLPVFVSIFGSMSQPLFGLVSDRFKRIGVAAVSVLVAAGFMSLIGFAPNLWVLGLLLVLGSLGVSAFHPSSAAAVTEGHQRANFFMSVFMVGGSAGLATSPSVVSFIAHRYGLSALWVVVFPGVLMALALLAFMRGDKTKSQIPNLKSQPTPQPTQANPSQPKPTYQSTNPPTHQPTNAIRNLQSAVRNLFERGTAPIWLLWGIATTRSFAFIVFQTFISFLGKERGWNVEQSGHALSLFLFSGAAGALTGGSIADKVNAKGQIALSCLLTIPFLVAFVHLDGAWALVSFGIAGFLSWIAQPVNVALAQKYRPQSAGAVSGLMLGLAWGTAGLFVRPFGGWAESVGVAQALTYAPVTLLLAAAWAMMLPKGEVRGSKGK